MAVTTLLIDSRRRITLARRARSLAGLALAALGVACSSSNEGSAGPSDPSQNAALLPPQGEPPPEGSSGVCGFTELVAYGPVGADGLVDVPANDPHIHYLGRVDCERSGGPAFAFPAVSVRVRFTGDALDLRLNDGGTGGDQGTNYYDVSIDGAEPTRLEVRGGSGVYPLARDLTPGEHRAEIVKRVEANQGRGEGQVLGLRLREGESLLPVRQRPLKLEFVGDSITCGYGNEVSTNSPEMFPYTTINQNANQAYGAVAARALGADYVAVAISGRGVYRNYADGAGSYAAEFFEATLPDDSNAPPWDFSRYTPDAVVVNLGTNDFSPPGPDHEAYRQAYGDLLRQIRGHYPRAVILAVVGTMLNDGFPPGVRAWTTNQEDISGVVADLNAAGDDAVHYLALTPQSAPFGEDYHPTLATHARMAEAVAEELGRLLGVEAVPGE